MGCVIQRLKKFAPCIWFGNSESGSYADLAKGRDGLRPAGHNFYPLERSNVVIALVGGLYNSEKSAGAHAGQKNDYVEFACEEPRRKRERFTVGFKRHLPHRRRDDGLATISGNQFGQFGSASAFQRQNLQSTKSVHHSNILYQKRLRRKHLSAYVNHNRCLFSETVDKVTRQEWRARGDSNSRPSGFRRRRTLFRLSYGRFVPKFVSILRGLCQTSKTFPAL